MEISRAKNFVETPKMKNRLFLVLAITFAFAGFAAAESTVTGSLSVSGTIPSAGCQLISVDPLNSGTLDGTNTQGTGMITLNCPSGLPYLISLDAGLYYLPTTRNLNGPDGDKINYFLFKDVDRNLEWGDSCNGGSYAQGSCLAGTGTGFDNGIPVFGLVNGATEASDTPGLYGHCCCHGGLLRKGKVRITTVRRPSFFSCCRFRFLPSLDL